MRGAGKFYAVAVGRRPAIYNDWASCEPQVKKFKGSKFKSFATLKEAEQYMLEQGAPVGEALDLPGQAQQPPPQSQPARARLLESAAAEPAEPPADTPAALQPAAPAAKRSHGEAFQSFTVAPNIMYRLEFDGAARRNPGPAGAGAVLCVDSCSDQVGTICVGLGHATNNVAEYSALVYGLEAALQVGVKRLKVYGDSALVVNQVNGAWKVSKRELQPLYERARALRARFSEFSIQHVYRDDNKVADALSNEAIDTGGWAGLKTAQGIVPVSSPAPVKAQKLTSYFSAGGAGGSKGLSRAPRKDGEMPLEWQLQVKIQAYSCTTARPEGSWGARKTTALAATAAAEGRCLPATARSLATAVCQPAFCLPPGPHSRQPDTCRGLALGWQAGSWGPRRQSLWDGRMLHQYSSQVAWTGGEGRVTRQPRGLLALMACRRRPAGAEAGRALPACLAAPGGAAAPAVRSRLCSCTGLALRMVRARAIV